LTLRLGGGIEAVRGASGVPVVERLLFEGFNEVRGYTVGSVGPDYGGNVKATGRAELEFPISRRLGLSVAAFYDAGYLGGVVGAASGVAHSVGAGLIWRSPIGPIRLDLARPLNGERDVMFLLSIGFGK
jgi:translocation and assembly module TamA